MYKIDFYRKLLKGMILMICPECGASLNKDAEFCMYCGSAASKPLPKSYMTPAIITTVVFANWIFGIPAIVFAKECELAAKDGQIETARRFSRRALTFMCLGSALSAALIMFAILVVAMTNAVIMP